MTKTNEISGVQLNFIHGTSFNGVYSGMLLVLGEIQREAKGRDLAVKRLIEQQEDLALLPEGSQITHKIVCLIQESKDSANVFLAVSTDFPAGKLMERLVEHIGGKGGGTATLAQAGGCKLGQREKIHDLLCEWLGYKEYTLTEKLRYWWNKYIAPGLFWTLFCVILGGVYFSFFHRLLAPCVCK